VNFDTVRFFGPPEKLWPLLFGAPGKAAQKLCRDCRKAAVEGIRRYCARCALKRKRESDRRHARAKRRLDVEKTEIRPLALRHLRTPKFRSAMLILPEEQMSVERRADNDPGAVYSAAHTC
jgi:hypothetical protein